MVQRFQGLPALLSPYTVSPPYPINGASCAHLAQNPADMLTGLSARDLTSALVLCGGTEDSIRAGSFFE